MSEIVQKMLSIIFSLSLLITLFSVLYPAIDFMIEEQSKVKDNQQMNLWALEIISEMQRFNNSVHLFKHSSKTNFSFRFNPNFQWKMTIYDSIPSDSLNESNALWIILIQGIRTDVSNLSITLSFHFNFSIIAVDPFDANLIFYFIKEGGDIYVKN